jgi:hypothetical protein
VVAAEHKLLWQIENFGKLKICNSASSICKSNSNSLTNQLVIYLILPKKKKKIGKKRKK